MDNARKNEKNHLPELSVLFQREWNGRDSEYTESRVPQLTSQGCVAIIIHTGSSYTVRCCTIEWPGRVLGGMQIRQVPFERQATDQASTEPEGRLCIIAHGLAGRLVLERSEKEPRAYR